MNRWIKNIFILLVIMIGVFTAYFIFKGEVPFKESVKYIEVEQPPQLVVVSGETLLREDITLVAYEASRSGAFFYEPEGLESLFSYSYEYDKRNNTAIFATFKNVYRFDLEGGNHTVNNQPYSNTNSIKINGGQPLLNLSLFSEEIGMELSFIDEKKVVVAKDLSQETNVGVVDEKIYVRKDLPRDISKDAVEVVGRIDAKDKSRVSLYIGQLIGDYREVLTADGLSGYIMNVKIKDLSEGQASYKNEGLKALKGKSGKIFLGWDNEPGKGAMPDLEHINILSPTWYSMSSKNEIKSIRNEAYRNWVYSKDIELWPLFSNSFDLDRTHEMLSNSANRKAVIDKLIEIYVPNKYHGINIDFENVYLEDKALFVQFIAELVPMFHANNMVVSIDVTVEGGSDTWSRFLDRRALGKLVDYMAVMTYDEHWKSSPISGPVASYDWVDTNMAKLVKKVDSEKLILGMPFYIRVWQETPSTSRVNQMKVRARDLYMTSAAKIIEENGLQPIWDEENGQNYVSYIKENIVYKIWLEDAKSLALKAKLVGKYDLAGGAGWSVRFTNNDILKLISKEINN